MANVKIVAARKVGPDGKLFRYAYQAFCSSCGYLGNKVSYRGADWQREHHRCG